MSETIVIGVVVLIAALWATRAVHRSVKNSGGCSSCASSGECPLVNNPEALAELTRKGQAASLESCHPQKPSCAELVDSYVEDKPV